MATAAQNAAWCRTFAVLAQIFNVNRDPKKAKPVDPMQFYAWGESNQRGGGVVRSTEETRAEMRGLFSGKAKGKA